MTFDKHQTIYFATIALALKKLCAKETDKRLKEHYVGEKIRQLLRKSTECVQQTRKLTMELIVKNGKQRSLPRVWKQQKCVIAAKE